MADEFALAPEGFPCPSCGLSFGSWTTYCNHVRKEHSRDDVDADVAVFNKEDQSVFTRCGCCKGIFTALGIGRHRASSAPCKAAYQQGRAANGGDEGTLPAAAPDLLTHDIDLGLEELKKFVRLFSKPLLTMHHSWIPHMRTLVKRLWGARYASEEERDLADVAFMLLPGIVRHKQLLKKHPIKFLVAAATSSKPVNFIVNTALELEEEAVSQPTIQAHARTVENAVRRVEKLCRQQRLGTACKHLGEIEAIKQGRNAAQTLTDDEKREALESLNPRANEEDVFTEEDWRLINETNATQLEPSTVLDALLHLPLGSAAGWSGWTFNVIHNIIVRAPNSDELCKIVCDKFNELLKGNGNSALWTVCRAVLIPKDDGGKRPLGILDAWIRLMGKCTVKVEAKEVGEALLPWQFGVGKPSGCEIAGRIPQLALDSDPSMVDISLDQKNAYNTMRRRLILHAVLRFVPRLAKFFAFSHKAGADLVLDGTVVWHNETGIVQGNTLATILYPCGLQSTLEKLADRLRTRLTEGGHEADEGTITAFMDDTNLTCPADIAGQLAQDCVDVFAEDNLPLNLGKCKYILGSSEMEPSNGPEFEMVRGHKCLGAPTGTETWRENKIESMLDKMAQDLVPLREIEPLSALKLLRMCINTRPGYLSRVSEFQLSRDKLIKFDERVDSALYWIVAKKSSLGAEADHLPLLRALRTNQGGLGMIRHGGCYGEKACLLSRSIVTTFITQYLPGGSNSKLLTVGAKNWPALSVREELVGTSNGRYTPMAGAITKEILSKKIRDIQATCALGLNNLLTTNQRPGEAAALLSAGFKGSGKWLDGGHIVDGLTMRGDIFVEALRLRLLLPSYENSAELGETVVCGCGARFNMRSVPFHFIDCQRKGEWFWRHRHDAVLRFLMDFLRKVRPGCALVPEPPVGDDEGRARRGDVKLVQGARSQVVDVVVCDPACATYLGAGSAVRQDTANLAAERRKNISYQNVGSLVSDGNFVPFAVETTGRIGPAGMAFITGLAGDNELFKDDVKHLIYMVGLAVMAFNGSMVRWMRKQARQIHQGMPDIAAVEPPLPLAVPARNSGWRPELDRGDGAATLGMTISSGETGEVDSNAMLVLHDESLVGLELEGEAVHATSQPPTPLGAAVVPGGDASASTGTPSVPLGRGSEDTGDIPPGSLAELLRELDQVAGDGCSVADSCEPSASAGALVGAGDASNNNVHIVSRSLWGTPSPVRGRSQ